MSKRFYYDEFLEEIYDEQIDDYPSNQSICGILNQQAERIAELEEQLKNAIRFKTPQIERFAVVQYIHWEKKPYKIVNCFDAYKDENMKTRYCFYGVPSTNFKVIEICNTKEEAQAKLRELTAKNV